MIKDSVYQKGSKIDKDVEIYRAARITDSKVGKKCIVGDFSRIYNSTLNPFVKVDRNCLINYSSVGRCTYFGTQNMVVLSEIGQFTSIAWNISIGPFDHDYKRPTMHDFLINDRYGLKPKRVNFLTDGFYEHFMKKTRIGNDVWIGANAVIAKGLTVGDGAVIGANAMVTKDVPPYAIVVGNPGRILKYRFEKEVIDELLDLKWWDLPMEVIRKNYRLFKQDNIHKFIKKMKK